MSLVLSKARKTASASTASAAIAAAPPLKFITKNSSAITFMKQAAFRTDVNMQVDDLGKPTGVLTQYGITLSGTPEAMKAFNALLQKGDRANTYSLDGGELTVRLKPGVLRALLRDGVY